MPEKFKYMGKERDQNPDEIIDYRVVKPFTHQKKLQQEGDVFQNVRHLKWEAFASGEFAIALEDEEKKAKEVADAKAKLETEKKSKRGGRCQSKTRSRKESKRNPIQKVKLSRLK